MSTITIAIYPYSVIIYLYMNLDQYPKRYRIEFIEPGICNYEDVNQGKVFVSREALDRMKSSFIGKPVVNEVHKSLTAQEAFKLSDEERESLADGIVYNCGWLDNGWCFADVIIWDLQTQKNIDENRYLASCAYIPKNEGKSGKWHGFDYNEEILDATYTHMAIVKDPRYEGMHIYELPNEYMNSTSNTLLEMIKNKEQKMAIFKFFLPKEKKNNLEPERKEETPDLEKINADESFIDIDGEKVPLSELIKTWQVEQSEKQITENAINPEDEVEVDGNKVKAKELVDCYMRNKAKMNAEPEPKIETEEEKKERVAKENAKGKEHFNAFQSAIAKGNEEGYKMVINTKEDRIAEGKKRYGSVKEVS